MAAAIGKSRCFCLWFCGFAFLINKLDNIGGNSFFSLKNAGGNWSFSVTLGGNSDDRCPEDDLA